MIRIIICLVLLILNTSISAQTIVTDRQGQTESSSTVAKGSLQIETGVLLGISNDDEFSYQQVLAPTTLFRLRNNKKH